MPDVSHSSLGLHPELLAARRPIASRADVIAVGGAEDKENDKLILRDFINRAGGCQARVTIVPAASGIPEVLGALYQRLFREMGAAQVWVLDIRNPIESRNPAALEIIQQSSGVFFTGGDQERLAEVLGHTDLMHVMRQQCLQGQTVIAGTSAGASALGMQMIARGYSGESPTPGIVTVKRGLGILPHLLIDQHFHNRNRLARLITAVAYHPQCWGIGIDENTAAVIHADNTLEVLGSGSVTVIDGREVVSNVHQIPSDKPYNIEGVRLHFLTAGHRFHLA
ncbi:MAG: cyanophycinase [Thermostichales cyanobacterium SZTDM-1c_bins_54]